MFHAVSEFAIWYFQIGAVIGFGLGAIAQVLKGKSREWTLLTCLVIVVLWPAIIVDVIRRRV